MKLLKRKRNMDHVTNFIPSPCKMSIVYTQKNIRMFIKFHCKNAVFTTPKVNTSTFITHHLDLIGHGSTIKMQLEHNARRCLQWKKSQPRRKSHYVVNLVLNTVAAAASAARIEKVFMRFGSLSTTSSAVTIQFMMFLFEWYLAPQDIIKLLFSNWRRRYSLPDNNRSHHKCLVHHWNYDYYLQYCTTHFWFTIPRLRKKLLCVKTLFDERLFGHCLASIFLHFSIFDKIITVGLWAHYAFFHEKNYGGFF